MKILQYSLLLIAFALCAVACKKKPMPGYSTFSLNEVFEMKLNQSKKLKDGDLKLTFKGILEDSRCPKGVNCFQEGQVRINIGCAVTALSKTIDFTRKPSTQGSVSKTFEGFKIQLLEVAPFPEKDKKIAPEDYVIKLAVRK